MKPSPDERRRALKRSARRELEAARTLGTERIHRGRSRMSAPDVRPLRTPSGHLVGAEVKTRKRLPTSITGAIAQARRYHARPTIPIGIVSATGEAALAVLSLRDLCELLGLQIPIIIRPRRQRVREPKQLELLATTLPHDAPAAASATDAPSGHHPPERVLTPTEGQPCTRQ